MTSGAIANALDRPITELAALVAERVVSPVELVRESLARIERDASLGAYISVRGEAALADARRAEREPPRGPLHGLPVALKDNIDTAGLLTTCGSAVFADRVPSGDAVAWALLRDAGAILVGKTSLHEFAYGAPHPAFGPTRNPHDPDRVAGGSSSGSAVAVAAGHVVAALGTDTGGSVRQPAAFCGVIGLKPTNGAIPTDGIFPLAPTLDCVGVITRDAADAGLVLGALATSAPSRRLTHVALAAPQAGGSAEPEVRAALVALAERIGASPVDLPDLAALHAAHRAILRFEAYRTHRELLRSDAARYGPRLRSALEEGAAVNEVAYRDALDMRSRAAADLTRILRDVDAVLLPVVPCVAPPLDPATGRAATAHELTRWTFLANLTGLPAVAFPVGAHAGLPLSLQLIGRPGEELSLLEAARAWTASA